MHGPGEHGADAQLDTELPDDSHIVVKTKNVTSFALTTPWKPGTGKADRTIDVQIDGGSSASMKGSDLTDAVTPRSTFTKTSKGWSPATNAPPEPVGTLHKRPGLQGPIDDAFM